MEVGLSTLRTGGVVVGVRMGVCDLYVDVFGHRSN